MAKRRKNNERTYVLIMTFLLLAAIIAVMALIIVMSLGGSPNDTSGESNASLADTPSKDIMLVSSEEVSPDASDASEVSETSSEEPLPLVDYETRVGKEYQIDIDEYLPYIEPADAEKYTYLVNLSHSIGEDYIPENLVVSQYTRKDGRDGQQLVQNVEKALEAFMKEAALNGVTNVSITSAYRSASYQRYLFDLYTGQEMAADPSLTREQAEAIVVTYSMRPGCSEHQTGLCFDMHNLGAASQAFGNTPEGKWMAENCYRFGFILRYASDKEDITGVEYEPWHFRFVGREAATQMHELGMCLEEYTEYLGGNE